MPLNRRQIGFLLRFFGLLILFYVVVTPEPVDRHVVTPFTAAITAVSAGALRLFGEPVTRIGTMIQGPHLTIDVKNGCNGLEAMVFVAAAIVAFHAPPRMRLIGVAIAFLGIQVLNIIRIVSLFLLGSYHRRLFDMFHLAVWQSLIFGAAVLMFFVWTTRVQRDDVAARS